MRHKVAGFNLKREVDSRNALLRNLATSVILEERIITTVPKAKAVRPLVEKMITLAKADTLHSRRQAAAVLRTPASVKKLFDTLGTRFGGPFPNGIPEPSYNTWNIGIGFTYKVFTLDLRYSDTNLSKGNCNALTSDYATTSASAGYVTAINPGGFGSNWCGAAGIVKLSADLTAMTSLK